MIQVRVPYYFKDFKCIQNKCPDDCCYGWRVYVDKATAEKCLAVDQSVGAVTFEEALHLLPISERTEKRWASIEMREKDRCPFYRCDGRCAIHTELGEDYLPRICAAYPRRITTTFHRHEMSLALSCPEAARLALSSPSPMVFIDISHALPREQLVLAGVENIEMDPLGFYYSQLQDTAIRLLQNRGLDVGERLLLLGMMTEQLETLQQAGDLHKTNKLIEKFSKTEKMSSLGPRFKKISSDPHIAVAIASELVSIGRVEGFKLPGFLCLIDTLTESMKITEGTPLSAVTAEYRQLERRFYSDIVARFGYVLEHYLVTMMFQLSFPFAKRLTPFGIFMQIVAKFTIVKMLILSVARHEARVSKERAIEIIQIVTKVVEHSPKCLSAIELFLKENNIDNLGHMATLLLN